jgi:hypothetical protein
MTGMPQRINLIEGNQTGKKNSRLFEKNGNMYERLMPFYEARIGISH